MLPKVTRLRTRLTLLLLLAMLPPFLVIIETTIEEKSHLESDAKNTVKQFTQYAMMHHEALVEETYRLLGLFEEVDIDRDDGADCNQVLEKLLYGNPIYANFGIIGPDGDVKCSATLKSRQVNLSDRAYFITAMQKKKPVISTYQIGRIVNKPVQVIAKPILNKKQEVVSIVYAALNLDWLKNIIPVAALPDNSSITVIDRNGIILSRYPDPENKWRGVNLIHEIPVAKKIQHDSQQDWLLDADGVDDVRRIYSIARLGGMNESNGYIAVGIPRAPLFFAIQKQFRNRSLILVATFVVVIFLAWFGSESLVTRRTRTLAMAARQLRNGEMSARAEIRGGDEIAHLAHEFNHMAESLQSDYKQILRLNRVHGVLSGINGSIVRIRDRELLLDEACHIAVEFGELRYAWIGMYDANTGYLKKVASCGDSDDYIDALCLNQKVDSPTTYVPCIQAIQNDNPVIFNRIKMADSVGQWKDAAIAHKFRSLAVMPLRNEGTVIGILALYAGEEDFFSEQERDLFLEVAADISLGLEYINKDMQMSHLHYHDILTGLPNRRLLEERLQQEILRARHNDRCVGVVVVNITGFRRLAGFYGNHIADEVLTVIGKHLSSVVRDGDTVARLEGDEFAIILNDIASITDITSISQEIINSIPPVVTCASQEIHLTVHGGLAIYPDDGEEHRLLISRAILASTSNKSTQSHSVSFYSSGMQQHAQEYMQLEQALRHALERGDELELYYQPVVDIHSHRIVSLEALSRWNSKDLGWITPSRFIPIAEESGLICQLGQWALTTAHQQIGSWERDGCGGVRVAVNVSFVQLRQDKFIENLSTLIGGSLTSSNKRLGVEITESELMDNIDTTISQMRALKEMGITCYLDDFGTGYSSLSHLHNLPLDILKVDQSFVRNMVTNENSMSIVKAIIALAKSLGIKTIAEGVETTEQLAQLKTLGCDYVQGYLFSKPVSSTEITAVLQKNEALTPCEVY